MKKTIRQIADDLKTNKQQIYRIIKNNNIMDIPNENGKSKYYDESAVKLITLIFESKKQKSHQESFQESHQESHQESFQKSHQNNTTNNSENPLFIGDLKQESFQESFQESHQESHQKSHHESTNIQPVVQPVEQSDYQRLIIEMKNHINDLQKQLDIKDKQLEKLNERLSEISAVLISVNQSLQASQALHAGTIKNQLDDKSDNPQSVVAATESVKKKKWFKFR